VSGSGAYRVQPGDGFERRLLEYERANCVTDALVDAFRKELLLLVQQLARGPQIPGARPEGFPKKTGVVGWDLWKVRFGVPGLSGSAAQGRLMYLVNRSEHLVRLVWVYSHKQFEQRPSDRELKAALAAAAAAAAKATTTAAESTDAPATPADAGGSAIARSADKAD
jgi:hypothetical protein